MHIERGTRENFVWDTLGWYYRKNIQFHGWRVWNFASSRLSKFEGQTKSQIPTALRCKRGCCKFGTWKMFASNMVSIAKKKSCNVVSSEAQTFFCILSILSWFFSGNCVIFLLATWTFFSILVLRSRESMDNGRKNLWEASGNDP